MKSGNGGVRGVLNRSIRWELERLEQRLMLSGLVTGAPVADAGGFSNYFEIYDTVRYAPVARTFGPTVAGDSVGSAASSSTPVGLTPAQICHAYGMDQVTFGAITGDGTGQTIAIVGAYNAPTIVTDLHAFDQTFFPGQPDPSLTIVGQTGTPTLPGNDPAGPGAAQSWSTETSLDVEWAHAMAPKAGILLVEANSHYYFDLYAAVDVARNWAGVSEVSMSWGNSEGTGQSSYDVHFTTPAGHAGVTFLAATGDKGKGVSYPSTSPNVLAVGGTTLNVDGSGNYLSEIGWSGSGGGVSAYESQPPYQQPIVSASYRAVPDVAADADPATGVPVYDAYDFGTSSPWAQIGGTSLACPLWAGMIAVANQGRAVAGMSSLDGLTGTLPAIYKAPAADFRDITSGNNGYPAGVGYDLVTGMGTPVANGLIPYLLPIIGLPSRLGFPQPPANTTAGNVINGLSGVRVAVQDPGGTTIPTNSSTVTLTLSRGTFAGGGITATATAVNGIAIFNNLIIDAVGNYTLTASDGALKSATSGSFTINVAAADKLGFTLLPHNTVVATVMTPTVAVAVQDPFGNTVTTNNSTVTLTLSGGTFADGSTVVTAMTANGVATFSNLIINVPGKYTLTAGDGSLTGVASFQFTILPLPTAVVSVNRASPAGAVTDASSVAYAVTFSEPVTGVTSADFQLAISGAISTSSTIVVSPGGGYNSVYTVTVNNISGHGTLGLNLVDNGSILNQAGNHLANSAATFLPVQTFAAGPNPDLAAMADVNGDGKPDLVVTNEFSATGCALLGNGDGTFQAPQTFAIGTQPASVTAADLNGDGKPDLILTYAANSTIGVLLGNGDGTFQAQRTFVASARPDSFAVADLNGDGKLDLVTVYYWGNSINVMLGNGDGTFQPPQTYATSQQTGDIAVADVNGDGQPDLVVADGYGHLDVFPGNGDGVFQTPKTITVTGMSAADVTVADVNGDGRADLVVSDSQQRVWALLGNGDGTFRVQQNIATLFTYPDPVVADINGDGKPDIVFGNDSSGGYDELLGNGDGTFQALKIFPAAQETGIFALADLNGDGKPDLLAICYLPYTVGVCLGNNVFTGQVYTIEQPMQLAFTHPPTGATAGSVINGSTGVQVAVEDSGGTTVNTDSSVVTLTLSGGSFASGGNTTSVAAVNGVAKFSNLVINAAGSYTLNASDGALTGATSGNFTISAAAAAKITFTQQPAFGMAGLALSPALVLAIQDTFGNTVAANNSTVTLTLSGGTFADSGTTETATAAGGAATFSNLIIAAKGNYTLTASDGSLTGATSGSFTVYALGDVNHDGPADAADIDAVYAHFGDATGRYDLNGNGSVNQTDVDYLVRSVLQTGYGDTNMDRKIDFADFQVLLDHWQNSGQGWANGDFTGNGTVDFGDFQRLLDNWNPVGLDAAPQSDGTSMTSAAIAPAMPLTTPAVLTAAATASVPTNDPINLLSRNVMPAAVLVRNTNPSALPSAEAWRPTRPATRQLRHSAVSINNTDAGTLDLLTPLHSKPVMA